MKAHYVYTHSQEGRVFYVGCASTNINKRGTRAKRQRAYSSFGHTKAWYERAAAGYEVEIIFESDDRGEAFRVEASEIARLRAAGHPLVNICTGGAGAPGMKDPPEVRRKKAITKLGARNPMYGRTGARHPNARAVIDTATGVTYESVTAAAAAAGMALQLLHAKLTGRTRNTTTMRFA